MIPLVDLKKQYQKIKDDIQTAMTAVLDSCGFINGPEVRQLESDFAAISGAKFGVGASSGTTALYLALKALGVEEGDEVITAPNTFIATTEAISQTGACVRFVDIDECTYNIDVTKIESAINKKTKAIIPVHMYGQPADMGAILQMAQRHGLKVVADAAQAHLAEYHDQPIGALGDAVCYSFYPGKNLGAYGDAGMVLTNDESLANKMRMLSDHGRLSKYEHLMEGYNFRLDALQAAVLNVKLKHLSEWTKARRRIAHLYDHMLKDLDIITPWTDAQMKHVYHLYVIRLKNRDEVKDILRNNDIASGIHYPIPLHRQKAYAYLGYREGDFPVAEALSQEILSLPMYPELEGEEVEKIVEVLTNINERSKVKV